MRTSPAIASCAGGNRAPRDRGKAAAVELLGPQLARERPRQSRHRGQGLGFLRWVAGGLSVSRPGFSRGAAASRAPRGRRGSSPGSPARRRVMLEQARTPFLAPAERPGDRVDQPVARPLLDDPERGEASRGALARLDQALEREQQAVAQPALHRDEGVVEVEHDPRHRRPGGRGQHAFLEVAHASGAAARRGPAAPVGREPGIGAEREHGIEAAAAPGSRGAEAGLRPNPERRSCCNCTLNRPRARRAPIRKRSTMASAAASSTPSETVPPPSRRRRPTAGTVGCSVIAKSARLEHARNGCHTRRAGIWPAAPRAAGRATTTPRPPHPRRGVTGSRARRPGLDRGPGAGGGQLGVERPLVVSTSRMASRRHIWTPAAAALRNAAQAPRAVVGRGSTSRTSSAAGERIPRRTLHAPRRPGTRRVTSAKDAVSVVPRLSATTIRKLLPSASRRRTARPWKPPPDTTSTAGRPAVKGPPRGRARSRCRGSPAPRRRRRASRARRAPAA